jgi:hypothetical protein
VAHALSTLCSGAPMLSSLFVIPSLSRGIPWKLPLAYATGSLDYAWDDIVGSNRDRFGALRASRMRPDFVSSRFYRINSFTTRVALWPPKPNELFKATLTFFSRAVWAVKSRSHSSSG